MNIELSPFLKYFPSYLRGKNFTYAHEELLRSISKLYIRGYKFNQVIKIDELYKCAKYIRKKYNKKNYPHIQELVTYVYTTDEVINPFGPWLKFKYFDLLHMYKCATDIIERKAIGLQTVKLAGVIFALMSFTQINNSNDLDAKITELESTLLKGLYTDTGRSKKEKLIKLIQDYKGEKDIIHISAPSIFYSIANISRQQFGKYATALDIKYIFEDYNQKGFKTTIWIANLNQLKESVYKFIKKNPINFDIYNELKNRQFQAGFDFKDCKECIEYEKRFSRDKTSLFAYESLPGNPLVRIHNHYKSIYIHTQIYLARYIILFASLYKSLPNHIISGKRNLFNKNLAKYKDEIIHQLQLENLNGRIYPISSKISATKGKHFEQIEKSKKIVFKISKAGIAIDIRNCNELLIDYKAYNKNLLDNPRYNKILDDFDPYKGTYVMKDSKVKGTKQNALMITELDKVRYNKQQLISILSSANDIRNKPSEYKIRGYYTANGASTHRMTCRDLNLQGLSKEISKEIIKASKDHILISLDVSGQDITIAANLAVKLFGDFGSFPPEHREEMELLYSQSLETLNKLRVRKDKNVNNIAKPIDHLTDLIYRSIYGNQNEVSSKELLLVPIREKLRKMIKTSVYVLSYGGGLGAISKQNEATTIEKTVQFILENLRSEADVFKILVKKRLEPIKSFEELNNELYRLYSLFSSLYSNRIETRNINGIQEAIINFLSDMMNKIEMREQKNKVFKQTVQLIKREYPGIIESFDYYRKYYNMNNLTYPTFLGWQTVIIDEENFIKNRYTKSASYPIQASGAEFIRQWLIELSKIKGYSKSWEIVNVIHDQVMIEVKKSESAHMKEELLNSAKTASRTIGVDPDTLHFSAPEVITDKLVPYLNYSSIYI